MQTLTYGLSVAILASVLATPSWAGGDGTLSSPTSTVNTVPTEVNSVSGISQPLGGIIQVNNGSTGAPNCGGGCAYINVRVAPTTGGSASGVEGTAGVVWQFGSAEAAQSQAIRLNSELQKYKTEQEIVDYLSRQLADALEKNQLDRARIVAIVLAPKIGSPDYRALLKTVTNGRIQE